MRANRQLTGRVSRFSRFRRRSSGSKFRSLTKKTLAKGSLFYATTRATGRYKGRKQKTYEEYLWEETDDVLLSNQAYSTPDGIQAFIFSVTDVPTMATADGLLYNRMTAHESYRLVYSGIEIKAQANVAGFSNGIQIGDVAAVPTCTTSAFMFFGRAAQSGVYNPPGLSQLCDGVENSKLFNFDFSTTQKKSFVQPGMAWNLNVLEGGMLNASPQYTYDACRMPWKPTMTNSAAAPGHPQNIAHEEVWSPGLVFANWLTGTTTPIRFTVRTFYKFQFKGKRLVTGNTSTRGLNGVASSSERAHVLRASAGFEVRPSVGAVTVEEEEDDEDEKKYSGSEEPEATSRPPPVPISRAASNTNAGLVRQLTNVNLGGPSLFPQHTPSKRLAAAPPLGTNAMHT